MTQSDPFAGLDNILKQQTAVPQTPSQSSQLPQSSSKKNDVVQMQSEHLSELSSLSFSDTQTVPQQIVPQRQTTPSAINIPQNIVIPPVPSFPQQQGLQQGITYNQSNPAIIQQDTIQPMQNTIQPMQNIPQQIQQPQSIQNTQQQITMQQPSFNQSTQQPFQQQQPSQQQWQQGQITQGQVPLQVVKGGINQQKKGSKITMSGFLMGCGVFLVIIVGLAAAVFYYFLSNPDQLGSVLPLETVQTLLQTFVALFFGFLFFLGFGFLVLNGYRVATIKDIPKGKYIAGLILGIFILVGSLGGGMIILNEVGTLAGQQAEQSNNIINILIPFGDGDRYLHTLNTPLIAPASLGYEINQTVLNRSLPSIINTDTLTNITLDCGNGQVIGMRDGIFQGRCLYETKGDYSLIATLTHIDRATGEERQTPVSLPTISFTAQMQLTTSNGKYTLNDAKDEIILGKAPIKLLFDANSLFTDLGLQNTRINRDLDNDKQADEDKTNDASLAYQLTEDKVHMLSYQLPELSPLRYTITARVIQSDVPICQINLSQRQDTLYTINAIFDNNQTPIEDYVFRIIKNGQTVDTERSSQAQTSHDFVHGAGDYVVILDFVTDEGKTGSCESDNIMLGQTAYTVDYALRYKTSQSRDYQTMTSQGDVYLEDTTVIVRQVPSYIQLNIGQISPRKDSTTLKVLINNSPIVALRDNSYEIAIDQNRDYDIEIVVSDNSETETRLPLTVKLQQDSIKGSLKAIPASVGEEPLVITLDASATQVTDPNDSIVYFSWDFGDGKSESNTTRGQVEHTYVYDYDNDNGEYNPSVTVKTQKGKEMIIMLESPLFVQKGQQDIQMRSSSHPSQRAATGDEIEFTVLSDGQVKEIERDFGDTEPLLCESRSCVDITHGYTTPGTYTIKAKVSYANGTVSHASMNMIIQ